MSIDNADRPPITPSTEPQTGSIPRSGEVPSVPLDRDLRTALDQGHIDESAPLGDIGGVNAETGLLSPEPVAEKSNDELRAQIEADVAQLSDSEARSLLQKIRDLLETRRGRVGVAMGAGFVVLTGVALALTLRLGSASSAPEGTGTSQGDTGTDGTGEGTGTTDGTETGGETNVTATEQLAQNITERPEAGTPEFQELVGTYENHAEGGEDVPLTFGHNVYGLITAALKNIPAGYWHEHIELSIDQAVDNTNPTYWGEIYSVANFGKPSAELSGDQLDMYNAFMTDLKLATAQYLTTAEEEHPADYSDVSGSTATIDPASSENRVIGTYTDTIQPNKNNGVSEQNPETSKPYQVNFGGVYERATPADPWYWVSKI